MADMYNPVQLVYNYRQLGHGTARADAIRYAISQAKDKKYITALKQDGMETIYCYGVACYKKTCKVELA